MEFEFIFIKYNLIRIQKHVGVKNTVKLESNSYPIVICTVDISGHPKVSDLHQEILPDQAISCRQVSVNKVLGSQIHHARGYLLRNIQHLRLSELCLLLHLSISHQDCIGTMSPMGGQTKRHSQIHKHSSQSQRLAISILVDHLGFRENVFTNYKFKLA